jgi:hypothetical protein
METTGKVSTSPTSKTTATFSFCGATMSVSANGATAGIAWVLDGSGGGLFAYDATTLGTDLYDVGTQAEVNVYGLLP